MPNDLLGVVVSPGALAVPGGLPGTSGESAWTRVAAAFTPPDIGDTVPVEVNSTAWLTVGAPLLIDEIVYLVVSIASTTEATLRRVDPTLALPTTGIGRFVLQNQSTIISPTLISPRLIGVTDGSDAAPGEIGELLVATPGTYISGTAAAWTQLFPTGLTLPPGDWDVTGHLVFSTAGVTALSGLFFRWSVTPNEGGGINISVAPGVTIPPTAANFTLLMPTVRYLLTTPTAINVAWMGSVTGSGSGMQMIPCRIRARRMR